MIRLEHVCTEDGVDMYHSSECLWSSLDSGDVGEFSGPQFLIGSQDRHPLQSTGKVETLVDLKSLSFNPSREYLFIWSKSQESVRHTHKHCAIESKGTQVPISTLKYSAYEENNYFKITSQIRPPA